MADSTLAALGAVATLNDADLFYVDDGPAVDGKVTGTVLKTYTSLSPTLVTPDIGTPSAGVMTNLTGTLTSPTFVTPALGTPASGVVTNLTGTLTSITLVTPALGTPASGVLTNCTGYASDLLGATMTTEEGSGWAGAAAYTSEIIVVGKKIFTQIFVDIAGLVVSTTLNDIIGDSAAANSHGGQFLASESGTVYTSGSITCLEAPTTGVADIDFHVAVESNGVENADVTALTSDVILLANTEAWTLGMTKAMALLPDATSDFLYLAAGVAGTPGTYDAGQFVIELIGYEA